MGSILGPYDFKCKDYFIHDCTLDGDTLELHLLYRGAASVLRFNGVTDAPKREKFISKYIFGIKKKSIDDTYSVLRIEYVDRDYVDICALSKEFEETT